MAARLCALGIVAALAGSAATARAHEDDAIVVSVQKTGGGSGLVVSEPAGIHCGAGCTASFAGTWESNYQPVTLRATPDPGSTFGGWEGACAGREPQCTLVLDDSKFVSARFEGGTARARYDVGVTVAGRGTVSTSEQPGLACPSLCSGTFEAGSRLTLRAVPADRWRFAGWRGACGDGSANPCVLGVEQPVRVLALFTPVPDRQPPRVAALASSGRAGERVRLRFRASDDSGRTREVAVVYRGARRVDTLSAPFAERTPDVSYYFLTWRAPRSTTRGRLRFCVVSFDEAGNRSVRSCAPLVIR